MRPLHDERALLGGQENGFIEIFRNRAYNPPARISTNPSSERPKGAFNIYVNKILTFFDHPPTPSKQTQ